MKFRAVFFDIYKTLLKLTAPPEDSPQRWAALCERMLGKCPLSLDEFRVGFEEAVAREHERAKARGVRHPEVYWPGITRETMPLLEKLNEEQLGEFLYQHAQLRHTFELYPGAAEVLSLLIERGVLLGIVSNCQPYTFREMDEALATAGLTREIFHRDLVFYSFQAGYAKPEPCIFRAHSARLKTMGIDPSEALMVGDRADNDIAPARAEGWKTWLLCDEGREQAGGDWNDLNAYLKSSQR